MKTHKVFNKMAFQILKIQFSQIVRELQRKFKFSATTLKVHSTKRENCSKAGEIWFFFQVFIPKCSSEHVEHSFVNPAENSKSEKFSPTLKKTEVLIFINYSLEVLLDT